MLCWFKLKIILFCSNLIICRMYLGVLCEGATVLLSAGLLRTIIRNGDCTVTSILIRLITALVLRQDLHQGIGRQWRELCLEFLEQIS